MVEDNTREWLESCWNATCEGDPYCVEVVADWVLEKNFKRAFALPEAKSHARWLQKKRSTVRP